MQDINKRLVEIDELLKHLEPKNYEKLPKEFLDSIKEKKDKEYTWKYDETKPLDKQELPRDTFLILSYINYKYLLNDAQKEYVDKIRSKNYKEKYYGDNTSRAESENVIKNDNENVTDENNAVNNDSENIVKEIEENKFNKINLPKEKTKNIFSKLLEKIKGIFSKKGE